MFTGIIEEIGIVTDVREIGDGKSFTIRADKISEELGIGESVNVDGVCLTAVKKFQDSFSVEAVGETLEKTTLWNFHPGRRVNLERALKANGRLGGILCLAMSTALQGSTISVPEGRTFTLN
jgi:riboflavin synthase